MKFKLILKKLFLYALVASGFVGAVNYLVFLLVKIRYKHAKPAKKIYKWRHGKISYSVCGKGEPILLVHGVGPGRSGDEWDKAAVFFAKAYQVYIIDLLGFGLSDSPKIDYSSYLYSTLINEFTKDVIGGKTSVITQGLSGAYAAFAYTMSPEIYNKIIIVDAKPGEEIKWVDIGSGIFKDYRRLIVHAIRTPIIGTLIYNIYTSRPFIRNYLQGLYGKGSSAARGLLDKHYIFAHIKGPGARYLMRAYIAGYLYADINRADKNLANLKLIIAKGMPYVENPLWFYEKVLNIL